MSIYTKNGDQGQSSLGDQKKRLKDELVFEVLGDLDELQAWMGKLRDDQNQTEYHSLIIGIQKSLLAIGGFIATDQVTADFPTEKMINDLEVVIDQIQNELPPLRNFILYGGHPLVSNIQIARAVCRRVERHLVSYDKSSLLKPEILIYMNRLSDVLFCLSRFYSYKINILEIKWLP